MSTGEGKGENVVLVKIAAMPEKYRALGSNSTYHHSQCTHHLRHDSGPGMPAYAQNGKVICFFRGAENERYMTLGFTENENLDEGHIWPTSFALKNLTSTEETRITALVKKAVSED